MNVFEFRLPVEFNSKIFINSFDKKLQIFATCSSCLFDMVYKGF